MELAELPMARSKRGGRPRDDRGGTKGARVFSDLYEKIRWISEVEDISQAELLDPILRSSINLRYRKWEADIENLKRVRAQAKAEKKAKG